MTKGQRAMAVAKIYPDGKHGGKREAGASLETQLGFNKALLSQARSVIAFAPELADNVMGGSKPSAPRSACLPLKTITQLWKKFHSCNPTQEKPAKKRPQPLA